MIKWGKNRKKDEKYKEEYTSESGTEVAVESGAAIRDRIGMTRRNQCRTMISKLGFVLHRERWYNVVILESKKN